MWAYILAITIFNVFATIKLVSIKQEEIQKEREVKARKLEGKITKATMELYNFKCTNACQRSWETDETWMQNGIKYMLHTSIYVDPCIVIECDNISKRKDKKLILGEKEIDALYNRMMFLQNERMDQLQNRGDKNDN